MKMIESNIHHKMRSLVATMVFALIGVASVAQETELSDQEKVLFGEAIENSDNGNVAEAIKTLEGLHKKHPRDFYVAYELGYAYFQDAKYEKALQLSEKLEKNGMSNDMVYQMKGNALDYLGRRGEAMQAYRAGLKKYPNSGKLYLEIGNIFLLDKEYDNALAQYEKGIEVEPLFASNYYRAAILLLNSSEPVMGLIYGEVLRLLEPTGERSNTMSKLMAECYRDNIKKDGDGLTYSFTGTTGSGKDNFSAAYEMAVARSHDVNQKVLHGEELSLLDLEKLKSDVFVALSKDWRGYSDAIDTVFDFEQKVIKAGHWKAYCMWLLRMGDETVFNAWLSLHESDMESFAVWFNEQNNAE